MLLTANSLMCCDPVKFIFKAKPLTNHMTENIISSSIITNKSSNLCFNAILNKNQLKHLPLICTTLTRFHSTDLTHVWPHHMHWHVTHNLYLPPGLRPY